MSPPSEAPTISPLWLRVGLIVLVAATFAPLAGAEFIRLDDAYTLHHNPRLNPPTWAAVGHYWRDWHGEYGLYVPVTYTVWAALAWVGWVDQADRAGIHLNPWIFHAASISFHACAALVVFELLSRLIRNRTAAWIGAALWAVHPIQVEAVAWASGLKDVLGGLLSLIAIWQYLIFAQGTEPDRADPKPRSSAGIHYLIALLAALLAMLSKPSAMMVAPICLALDALFLRRPMRSVLRGVAPLLIIAIPIAVIARLVQDVSDIPPIALWARPLVAANVLTLYLAKLIVPIHFSPDYGLRPDILLARPMTYVLWIVPVALAILLWRTRNRTLWLAGLIFLLAPLPVIGLSTFQVQQYSLVIDHYMYVALLGPALAAAWALARRPSRPLHIAAGVIVILLAARSFAQTRYWHDDFVLFPHMLAINPNSFVSHNDLGTAYFARGNLADDPLERQHDWQTAADQFAAAIRIKNDYFDAYQNLARMLRLLGRREEAIAVLEKGLAIEMQKPPQSRGDVAGAVRDLAELKAGGKTTASSPASPPASSPTPSP